MADASAWLAKLEKLTPEQRQSIGWSDEDFEAAKKEHLLERDYTQSKQKVAALLKIQEARPDLSMDQVLQVYDWYVPNADTVKEALSLYNRRGELVERKPEPKPEPGTRKWRAAEAAALYETASLREVFQDLYEDATQAGAEAGYKRWKDEYTNTEVKRLDGVANNMASTVIDLMAYALDDADAVRRDPKHVRLDPREVLKQAGLRGERDFNKVATALREERLAATKPIEDDAYRRGLEEGKRAQEGPSGPLGGARPGWKPDTTEPAPKNRDEVFRRVVSAVEGNPRHGGRPVPL